MKAVHPAVLEEEYLRRDFEFEDAPATAKQKAALHKLNMSFLRETWLYSNPGTPSELVGEFLGLGKSQAAAVAKAVREMDGTPLAKLVVAVLGGMLGGELAGIRGTPLTAENRILFRNVATFSPSAHVGLLPSSLRVHRGDGGDDGDALRMLLSAFRCEFQEWMGESTCDQ